MKTFLVWLLFSTLAVAQNRFTYYSFTGIGPDVYTTATGTNGTTWTNAGGTAPQQINCPVVFNYQHQRYLYIADAIDSNLNQTTVHIAQVDSSNNVHPIWNYDFKANINGAAVVFAGRVFTDVSGVIHLFTPVATTTDYTTFQIYEQHSLNGTLFAWSNPVLISFGGGGPTSLDEATIYQVGTGFYAITGAYIAGQGNGGFGALVCSWSASTLLGPYTNVSCASTGGSPLASLNGTPWEVTMLYHNADMTNWSIHSENITTGIRKEYGSTCTGNLPTTCIVGTMTAWTMDQSYRGGTLAQNAPMVGSVQ